jgi:3-isopropylmalate dehydrogenase
LNACRQSDVVLLGAVGHPKYSNAPVRPEQGLLELRSELGLYANIRPVTTWSSLSAISPLKEELISGLDLVVVRELTGGIYYGERGRRDNGNSAYDTCIYTRTEIARVSEKAFRLARQRKKKVTLVDKANVLETSRLWRETVTDVCTSYTDVELEMMYVDNAAMQMIRSPKNFDVILTENMFGDILSDESSMLCGSLGLLPSASYGDRHALFEPVHGSYPEAAGLDIANPVAAILSGEMLLRHLGETEAADEISASVDWAMKHGIVTRDLNGLKHLSCRKVGELIALHIAEGDSINADRIWYSNEEILI